MERTEQESECVDESEEKQIPIINGLPDDISLSCLARVPRCYHTRLKCVSRRWRDLLCSEEWYDHRKKGNLAESWIYALCRDTSARVYLYALNPNSSKRSWRRIHEHPPHLCMREGMGFAAMGKRLYVLDGCGWSEDASHNAYCYDVAKNTWDQIPHLSTKRCYFTCETLDGKMYAIGGVGLEPSIPQTWDVYEDSTKAWESFSDTNIVPGIDDSFVMDGRIYVHGGGYSKTSNVQAAVYEPSTGTWKQVDDEMASGFRGPAVVVGDDLYVLDQSFGTTLTMWCKETRKWVRLGRLATRQPCRLVAVGNRVFVIGRDCYTVVVDVEVARKTAVGLMVCSSIPKAPTDDIFVVIGCRSVAI
ncbi:PREDICTED: F-box/kelch-repeat protein SKIP4 [Tarenaya hassleriana]|uniref:F-box/kelch-repeat protein SKIP4 n=1 Tax=Tarenaya hassleriana TaxID=28532 RepID=UPI00053C7C08|nr:PREDICTED: F-box/kelch-repeat protein SKIP4 [Tarenaya hassleriana]